MTLATNYIALAKNKCKYQGLSADISSLCDWHLRSLHMKNKVESTRLPIFSMLLWIIVSGHLAALCNCCVSCPGPVSLFAQDFQIALRRKSPTPLVWPQQRRGESQPSCTECFWAWPRLEALALLLEHSNGTTCLPMASGLEWIPDLYYFAAWPISGQLHPSPWALSGSDSICIIAFAHKGEKTTTIYNNSCNYGKSNLKRREKEGLGPIQIVYAQ